jgi:hypothetical protein
MREETEASEQSRLPMTVVDSAEGGWNRLAQGSGEVSGGESRAHTTQETGGDCNDIQPAVNPCCDWDTQMRFVEAKGISKQAEKGSVVMSGGHAGGCRF